MAKKSDPAAETEAGRLRQQRTILCEFGETALRTNDLDTVLGAATEAVSEAVGVRLVKILELLPDQRKMLVRAGVGWNPGVVGHATLGADEHSPGGYAVMRSEAVISCDLANEHRFRIPELLREHGVRSMVNVGISFQGKPWGVLEVDSPEGQQFGQDDILFLRNYTNLVGAAIERVQANRERDEALERNRVLLQEVQHRIANMVANVRALVSLTRKESRDLDEFTEAFDARLAALARTQILLLGRIDGSFGLGDLLRQELEAHGMHESDRLVLSGVDVLVPAEIVQAICMVFHELATNATKHGAFRGDAGRLDASWRLTPKADDDELLVRWRESGVEITGSSTRRGLGFRLINESVPQMIGGTSSFTFHPDGVEYTLRFPLPKPGAAHHT